MSSYFKSLKNMTILNALAERLRITIDTGIIMHYDDYLDELDNPENTDFVIKNSLVFTGYVDSETGYNIVYSFYEDDPSEINEFYDNILDEIAPRLFIDKNGYIGIVVYNLNNFGEIIKDENFVLCVYEISDD